MSNKTQNNHNNFFFFAQKKRKSETKQRKSRHIFAFFWRAHITTFSNYNLYNMTLLILAQFFLYFFRSMLNAKYIYTQNT